MSFNPLPAFLQEAEELVAQIEDCALGLSADGAPAETVNRLFRAFHTIKGSGAMCGLEELAEFTHHVESLLDGVRNGTVPVTASLAKLVLRSADHIKLLLAAAQSGAPAPAGSEALREALTTLGKSAAEREWKIVFRPYPLMLANGGSPAALFRELRGLGACEITAHTDALPALDRVQPDHCYLWWTIALRTAAGEDAIRDVFIFVESGSTLEIRPAGTVAQAPVPALQPVPAAPRTAKEATVRVPADKLDRLVNLVGEFVMNQSSLAQAAAQTAAPEFANPVQVLERLVAELRENVLGIRMLPIGTLFGRFRRVVHDLSAELGKEADLVTEGAETELDKSILDQLGEPLVHCLRNCMDHGIEPQGERMAQGKPPRATIRLSAAHAGSSVVIGVEDDGRGIDREAVRRKAIEKHLLSPDAQPSEREILSLILLPGFSTAGTVTNVSGRGVGMDAVKRQVDLLRGALAIDSTPGRGTRISITLPLTLAIIDGLLVQIGRDRFILPMSAVMENVELHRAERMRHNGRNLLAVRGEQISYIDLRRTFRIGGEPPVVEKVVIVECGGDRVGLVVERVIGSHQTVIQSLGKFYQGVDVVSGATIMGDGKVALILDVAAVVRHADRECREEEHALAS